MIYTINRETYLCWNPCSWIYKFINFLIFLDVTSSPLPLAVVINHYTSPLFGTVTIGDEQRHARILRQLQMQCIILIAGNPQVNLFIFNSCR